MSGRVPSEDSMLRIIWAAKECTVASERDLLEIKDPYTTYEAAVASIRTNIQEASRHLPSASSTSDVSRLGDDIVRYGGELKELENQYKATLDEEEAAYKEQRRSVLEKLCRNLVTTLGLPLFESTVQDLSSRDPSDWQDGSSWARAESNQHPAPSAVGVEHESTTSAAHPKNSGGTTSRKRIWDGASPSNRCKRLQTSNIHFNEVFENGQAQTKRIIVQHPKENGRWYILRCDKHNLDFGDKPVLIAGSHISSAQHGKLSRQKAVVIKHFGIEVLGCDKTLAEKNNAAARAAFKRARSGSQSTSTGDSSARSGRSRTQSCQDVFFGGDRRNQKGREPVVDPTPGDVYLGFWGKAKKSWAVLLLPTKNIGDVGVRGTIESLGLTGKVPACYDYDGETKEFRWAEGYEDGGDLVAKREFPVLYFDGRRKCGVGWLGAKDLVPFDAESTAASDIPHIELVRDYLRKRAREVSAHTVDSSVNERRGRQESSPSLEVDRRTSDSSPFHGSEASTLPQTDPSDGPSDTGANPGTSTNNRYDQADSPIEGSSEGRSRSHEDSPCNIGQAPVPEVGEHAAMLQEHGPVNQQQDADTPMSPFNGGLNVTNLVNIAQSAQRTAGLEKRPSPAAPDARSSPVARVSQNSLSTLFRHTPPSLALCRGGEGSAPGPGEAPNDVRNSELQMRQHPRRSGTIAGSQDLDPAYHWADSATYQPDEEGELAPLQKLRPILPAPDWRRLPSQLVDTRCVYFPPTYPLPQPPQLPSLLETASLPPLHTFLPEIPGHSGRPSFLVNSTAVPPVEPSSTASEVSTTTAGPTSCALNDSAEPRNDLWSWTFSKRLLDLLAKHSKNDHPGPDDFRDDQNLYHCPECKRKFTRLLFFTRHLFEKH